MAVKRRIVASWLLAGVLGACGDGKDVRLVDVEEGAEPSTSVSPLLPGGAATEEAGSAGEAEAEGEDTPLEPASCDPAGCPEVLLFGVLTPGCCRFGNLCGGRVQVSERTWACLGPEVNEQGEALRSALTRAARTPFVTDLACPSQVIDGDELRGCCRAGACGLDTQPWTRSAATFGLVLSRACLDSREASELAGESSVAGAAPRCGR